MGVLIDDNHACRSARRFRCSEESSQPERLPRVLDKIKAALPSGSFRFIMTMHSRIETLPFGARLWLYDLENVWQHNGLGVDTFSLKVIDYVAVQLSSLQERCLFYCKSYSRVLAQYNPLLGYPSTSTSRSILCTMYGALGGL